MTILGIDRITYGVDDMPACKRFFLDWGLQLVREAPDGLNFESLNGCQVWIRVKDDPALPPPFEAGSTLREVIWGVEGAADLDRIARAAPAAKQSRDGLVCIDPNGLGTGFRVSQKRPIEVAGVPTNTWDKAQRIDRASTFYERAEPIEVGHIVCFTNTLAATSEFYQGIGFRMSDFYPGRGHFLRCAPIGGHHDLFLLQLPTGQRGLNHTAFTVRDIHEVFGGGLHVSRCGWETQVGPGRHPISSAYFWYVKCPAGGLVEYFADEDVLTENWQAREWTPGPDVFAEWAIDGGIDGKTRRQRSSAAETTTHAGRRN